MPTSTDETEFGAVLSMPGRIVHLAAEGEGFEPPGLAPRRFQDAHIKPL
jgi:hypothetical protein